MKISSCERNADKIWLLPFGSLGALGRLLSGVVLGDSQSW